MTSLLVICSRNDQPTIRRLNRSRLEAVFCREAYRMVGVSDERVFFERWVEINGRIL
jgi:hypothetical protein